MADQPRFALFASIRHAPLSTQIPRIPRIPIGRKLGDQIATPHWQSKWVGKRLYDEQDVMLFRISEGPVKEGASGSEYQVDALTGATITTNAVTALMRYWFGPNGYEALLERLREQPPQEAAAVTGQEG